MGLQTVLQIGKQSLLLNQAALQTIGHNIANAGVEGYSRQEVVPANNPPLETNFGFLGTGVRIETVRQLVDKFLNGQLARFKSDLGSLNVQAQGAILAEAFLNESGTEGGINGSINDFFAAAEDLATTPEGAAERNALVNVAEVLVQKFNTLGSAIEDLQIEANRDITRAITEVNEFVDRIAELNKRITVIEIGGNSANDLRDERQRTLEKLSERIDTNFIEETDGALLVFVGKSSPIVSKGIFGKLVGVDNPDNVVGSSPPVALQLVKFEDIGGTKTDITTRITGGEIGGLLKFRDTTLRDLLDGVNAMAATLINEVNLIHRQGYGLDGSTNNDFFRPLKLTVEEASGNSRDIVTGNRNVKSILSNSSIFDSSQVTIADYKIEFTSPTTFEIIDQDTGLKLDQTKVSINGGPFGTDSAVKLFTFSDNTTAEFEGIRISLQKFGGNPEKGDAFTISVKKGAARSIAFNTLLGAETNKIAAAGAPGAPGDNKNALALANLRGNTVAGRGSATLSEFMNGIISNFGSKSADIRSRRDLTEQVTNSLKATREEVSGVSIDEELVNIIQFQQNFGATARLMSTTAELLQQIIDIL